MSSDQNRGQFVWHELVTTDATGAGEFYPRVAGWKTQPWELDSSYTLWVGGAGPMGGVMSLPEQQAPAASHWMPYIGTPDIAATVAAARDLGATVCRDVTQIPNGGSYAVLQDPQGVVFAVHGAAPGQDAWEVPGDFSWHELCTTDLDAALRFYSELFGWEKGDRHDMGEIGFYQLFGRNGTNIGGMYVAPTGLAPHWLSYVRVEDVDEATDAAKAAGGRVINGPMEVPGGDWIAQMLDPQGAAFAVHEVTAKAAKPAAPAKPAKAKSGAALAKEAATPVAKPAVTPASKPKSAARSAAARRPAARKKAVAKAKASRKRSAVRAAAAANSKRAARSKRSAKAKSAAPKKKAGAAHRRSAVRKKKVARKSARRLVRAKRRR